MTFKSKVPRSELGNYNSILIETKKIEELKGIYVQKYTEFGGIAPQKALSMPII